MGMFDKRFVSLLLTGVTFGSIISLSAQADNGLIVITRDVQPRMATRAPVIPDPNPTTVNANPSQYVLQQTNELSDGEFAGIASGSGISSMMNLNGPTNLGGNISTQNQLANQAGGRTGGGGNGIANMVNSSVQQGMGALKIITGDR